MTVNVQNNLNISASAQYQLIRLCIVVSDINISSILLSIFHERCRSSYGAVVAQQIANLLVLSSTLSASFLFNFLSFCHVTLFSAVV